MANSWTVACQTPLSMGFPTQEYWSGLPFPTAGNLPNPGPEPKSLMSHALTGRFFPTVPQTDTKYFPIKMTAFQLEKNKED